MLQGLGQLAKKVQLRPSSLSSKFHKQLTAEATRKHTRVNRVKSTATVVDPNKAKADREKAEEERIRSRENLQKRQVCLIWVQSLDQGQRLCSNQLHDVERIFCWIFSLQFCRERCLSNIAALHSACATDVKCWVNSLDLNRSLSCRQAGNVSVDNHLLSCYSSGSSPQPLTYQHVAKRHKITNDYFPSKMCTELAGESNEQVPGTYQ